MLRTVRWLVSRFRSYSDYENKLSNVVRQITGSRPINIHLYVLAMRHSSAARKLKNGYLESNERLEYLGDAILGAVVADFLFKKYPYEDEGYLTDIRSRIVSRESLGILARKLGLHEMIQSDRQQRGRGYKSMAGDAMEAFVGAVYLDRGYAFTKRFIIEKLIRTYLDLDQIIANDPNYKSQLIEWAQKNGKQIDYVQVDGKGKRHNGQFRIEVKLDGKTISRGAGFSKKKAEQDAARKACDTLDMDDEE